MLIFVCHLFSLCCACLFKVPRFVAQFSALKVTLHSWRFMSFAWRTSLFLVGYNYSEKVRDTKQTKRKKCPVSNKATKHKPPAVCTSRLEKIQRYVCKSTLGHGVSCTTYLQRQRLFVFCLFVVAVVNSCRRRSRYDFKIAVLGGKEKGFFLTTAIEAAGDDLD